jgi:hypothetical protein
MRSANRPDTTRSEPYRIEYAVTTHEMVPRLAFGKSLAISANATLTIDRSSVEMYAAIAVTTNVGHGLDVEFPVSVDVWLMISPCDTENVPCSHGYFAFQEI